MIDSNVNAASDTMVDFALRYAAQGLRVGPLAHYEPIPGTRRLRYLGPKGKVPVLHLMPHGVDDFTTNTDLIRHWWSRGEWNIGARLPESVIALDVDGPDRQPHPGTGMDGLVKLTKIHGPDFLPETYMQITGSGGRHYLYRRPPGKLIKKNLKPYGLDFKDCGGYIVMAPSIHPDSLRSYQGFPAPIAATPRWLIRMIVEPPKPEPVNTVYAFSEICGPSIADAFCESTTWADILMPSGWSAIAGDTECDGARWLHPTATSSCSATIRHGKLFVYSSNTPFETTSSGAPTGYSRFKAAAILAYPHLSEREAMSEFARQLRTKGIAP
jgi:hypothetical protein